LKVRSVWMQAQEYPEQQDAKQVEMPDKGVVATA
jgi:hypothetical protein